MRAARWFCVAAALAASGVGAQSSPQSVIALAAEASHPAARVRNDRLAILAQERADTLERLRNQDASDLPALSRLRADLAALDREYALVSGGNAPQPRHAPRIAARQEVKRVAAVPPQEVVAAVAAGSKAQPGDAVAFESWDVFKTVGKKER